jgi:hypothetical protein
MHLFGLNMGELLIPVWRGTFKCESTDDKATWDWATLVGATWQSHGKLVAAATKFFPSFFHRPPRNPAEKISSGYKATEYYLYLFGLGPGFFRAVLPKKYWKNFCKLVRGVHIIMQRRITGKQTQEAHSYMVQFVEEYEHLYYQRRMDRLHFARPCLHTLLHTGPEVLRTGNGTLTDQYTMERAIGELGKAIRQPSNPYGNLCQLSLRRAQASALKVACPELDDDLPHLPRYAQDLGAGFVLLRPREKLASEFSVAESEVIKQVCDKERRQKWGRLQLPNGQVARSLFSETRRVSEDTRISRNVKVHFTLLSLLNILILYKSRSSSMARFNLPKFNTFSLTEIATNLVNKLHMQFSHCTAHQIKRCSSIRPIHYMHASTLVKQTSVAFRFRLLTRSFRCNRFLVYQIIRKIFGLLLKSQD